MHLIGIDLGGTNLRTRLTSDSGQSLADIRMKLQGREPVEVVQVISTQLQQLCESHAIDGPLQLSFALAGMLDSSGKIVKNAPNLGWRDVPLVDLLQTHLPMPHETLLLNDLDAAAYGEFVEGAGKEGQHIACVFVGSGVGCGFVLDGQIYTGASRVAGEFGHTKVVFDDREGKRRRCGCGAYGCLEAYVGGHSLARIAQEAAPQSPFLEARELQNLSAADIEAGAAVNDPTCLEIWAQTAQFLGVSLANLVTLLNVDTLILGGGVLNHTPLLYQATIQHIQEHANPPAQQTLQILPPQLGDDAGLIGAIYFGVRFLSTARAAEHTDPRKTRRHPPTRSGDTEVFENS